MKPAPFPKAKRLPLTLSSRQEEIIRTIGLYRYMTALDVCRLHYSIHSLSHVREILSELAGGEDYKEQQFLYRFPLPDSSRGNREKIYTLGSKGLALLKNLGLSADWYFRPHKVRNFSHSHILHNIILTRIVISAHIFSRNQPDYTLMQSRLCYELARESAMYKVDKDGRTKALAIPDAHLFFQRQSDNDGYPLLVELDRGMEEKSLFQKHVRARLAFIRGDPSDYAKVFGTRSVKVCYLTTGRLPQYRETRRKIITAWAQAVLQECIFHGCLPPSPEEGCHPVHVKPATQSMGRLPPRPREAYHVDHRKVATYARRSLPPSEQRDAGCLLLV
jgi:hypothetical protein